MDIQNSEKFGLFYYDIIFILYYYNNCMFYIY